MTENEQKLEIIAMASAEFLAVLSRCQGVLLDGLADRPKAGKKKAARDALVVQLKAARELRSAISLIRSSQIVASVSPTVETDEELSPYSRALASIHHISEYADGWADGEGLAIHPSSARGATNALRHMTSVCHDLVVLAADDGCVCFTLQNGETSFILSFVSEAKVEVTATRDSGEVSGPFLVGIESKKFKKLWI